MEDLKCYLSLCQVSGTDSLLFTRNLYMYGSRTVMFTGQRFEFNSLPNSCANCSTGSCGIYIFLYSIKQQALSTNCLFVSLNESTDVSLTCKWSVLWFWSLEESCCFHGNWPTILDSSRRGIGWEMNDRLPDKDIECLPSHTTAIQSNKCEK